MESRSVVKMRNSLYICIPSSIAEALEIQREGIGANFYCFLDME